MTENEAKLWGMVAGLVGYVNGEVTGNELSDMFNGLAPDMDELEASRGNHGQQDRVEG